MARKLKTFVTSMGFFDLAVAAPSMKAAMEAWGMKHNAFHRGTASETGDRATIAATMAKPGTVLRRPVGTSENFQQDTALPAGFALPVTRPAPAGKSKASKNQPKKAARQAKKQSHAEKRRPAEDKSHRAAIISFEKARTQRDRARAKEEAAAQRDAEKRASSVEKAQAALENARKTRQERRDRLQRELELRLEEEEARWNKERRKLEAALDKARR
jgi:flagellar biosynthesis GTPase FlhF